VLGKWHRMRVWIFRRPNNIHGSEFGADVIDNDGQQSQRTFGYPPIGHATIRPRTPSSVRGIQRVSNTSPSQAYGLIWKIHVLQFEMPVDMAPPGENWLVRPTALVAPPVGSGSGVAPA